MALGAAGLWMQLQATGESRGGGRRQCGEQLTETQLMPLSRPFLLRLPLCFGKRGAEHRGTRLMELPPRSTSALKGAQRAERSKGEVEAHQLICAPKALTLSSSSPLPL